MPDYGISADIPILDPHISAAPEAGMIFRQIYDTLVYRDSGNERIPARFGGFMGDFA